MKNPTKTYTESECQTKEAHTGMPVQRFARTESHTVKIIISKFFFSFFFLLCQPERGRERESERGQRFACTDCPVRLCLYMLSGLCLCVYGCASVYDAQ